MGDSEDRSGERDMVEGELIRCSECEAGGVR